MVSKKSFTLLVASGTTPFFAFVSIISVKDCRSLSIFSSLHSKSTILMPMSESSLPLDDGSVTLLSIFHYLFRIKQHLSNTPGWNQPKNKQHWGWSKKSVAYKKKKRVFRYFLTLCQTLRHSLSKSSLPVAINLLLLVYNHQ